ESRQTVVVTLQKARRPTCQQTLMADTTQVANGQLSENELCRPYLDIDVATSSIVVDRMSLGRVCVTSFCLLRPSF
ncbi:hypothetical protein AB3X96_40920, partial [Paraburkholderia sp. BR13439]|uniref:hypothetical protein n=1 Tax=Paraburkholderia sp. BR13439 TaxID=3236996 RepID=UPI0034CD01F8